MNVLASVLANLSGAILDESVHPCLVLGFRWNLFFYIPVQYNVEYQHSPSLLHLLGRPGWPGTHYVVQADLQSFCLGLQSHGDYRHAPPFPAGQTFILLQYDPSIHGFFRAFILKGCWILSKSFSSFMKRIMQFLFLLCFDFVLKVFILWLCACVCHNACVEGRGKLVGVCSLLPHGFRGWTLVLRLGSKCSNPLPLHLLEPTLYCLKPLIEIGCADACL